MSNDINYNTFKPLDNNLLLDPELAASASPWLNKYIQFSRKWSPRSFDGFHEACGLWVLSTTAARRVKMDFGGSLYTGLYILPTGRTSIYAKSTVAKIALQTLRDAELNDFLVPDECTPQKFIDVLSTKIKEKDTSDDSSFQFPGQRGWFYDEFGQKLEGMSKDGGFMADFKGLIRRFDDFYPEYIYATISRGETKINSPYLALLANMTPDDISSLKKKANGLWKDGFFARFAFVTPYNHEANRKRFPNAKRTIPESLLNPLMEWHQQLGFPSKDDEGKRKFPSKEISCDIEIKDHFYSYLDFLMDTIHDKKQQNIDGNIVRFADKALRISMLLASLENDSKLEIKHWARAREITERWRFGIYELQKELHSSPYNSSLDREKKILNVLSRHDKLSVAQICNYVRNLSAKEALEAVENLLKAKSIGLVETARTKKYFLSN